MIPIKIDTSDLRESFSVSERSIAELIDTSVKEVTAEFASEWEKEAMSNLGSSREQYVRSIVVTDPGFQLGAVELVGELPNMIEQGADPFDMKEGLLNGPKSKMGANGVKYNTVPFTFGTPGALEENFSSIMPSDIYQVIKNKPVEIKVNGGMVSKGLTKQEIPEAYREPESKMVPVPKSERFEHYKIKSSIYEGMRKQQSNITGQNKYVSFRRVSENSDPLSWVHPGFQAKNFAEKALTNVRIEFVLSRVIDNFVEDL